MGKTKPERKAPVSKKLQAYIALQKAGYSFEDAAKIVEILATI